MIPAAGWDGCGMRQIQMLQFNQGEAPRRDPSEGGGFPGRTVLRVRGWEARQSYSWLPAQRKHGKSLTQHLPSEGPPIAVATRLAGGETRLCRKQRKILLF